MTLPSSQTKFSLTRFLICALELAWLFISSSLPLFRLYLVSGNSIYLDHVKGFLRRKRLIHNWLYLEENTWARQFLTDELFSLLEFDTKISQGKDQGRS